MIIYNKSKTKTLDTYDLEKGYLKPDTITKHYDKVEGQKQESHYELVAEYPYGKEWKEVIDKSEIKEIPEHDEIIDIFVYIPYTKKELEEIATNKLRKVRAPLLDAFDKWEKAVLRGREEDNPEIMLWFQNILDLDKDALENIPQRILYYKVD